MAQTVKTNYSDRYAGGRRGTYFGVSNRPAGHAGGSADREMWSMANKEANGQSHTDSRSGSASSNGAGHSNTDRQSTTAVRRSRDERSEAAKRGWETRRSKDAFK